MTINEIASATLLGLQSAASTYHRVSGDNPWWAPESFASAHVAMTLNRRFGAMVTLEEMESTLRRRGRGDARGRYHRDAAYGRCDVALYNDDGTVKAAIEVKRSFALSGLRGDATRLRGLYNKRTVKHGLIGAYGNYVREETAWSRVDELAEELGAHCLASRCRRNGPWNSRDDSRAMLFAVFLVR